MLMKFPPTYKELPVGTIAFTSPSAFGFQAVASPVPVSSAAIRLRDWPPALVKAPPTYSVAPSSARALTPASVPGFHASTEPLDVTWARFSRAAPPTELKLPPMYQPPAP